MSIFTVQKEEVINCDRPKICSKEKKRYVAKHLSEKKKSKWGRKKKQ
jgi:hypothetical protein